MRGRPLGLRRGVAALAGLLLSLVLTSGVAHAGPDGSAAATAGTPGRLTPQGAPFAQGHGRHGRVRRLRRAWRHLQAVRHGQAVVHRLHVADDRAHDHPGARPYLQRSGRHPVGRLPVLRRQRAAQRVGVELGRGGAQGRGGRGESYAWYWVTHYGGYRIVPEASNCFDVTDDTNFQGYKANSTQTRTNDAVRQSWPVDRHMGGRSTAGVLHRLPARCRTRPAARRPTATSSASGDAELQRGQHRQQVQRHPRPYYFLGLQLSTARQLRRPARLPVPPAQHPRGVRRRQLGIDDGYPNRFHFGVGRCVPTVRTDNGDGFAHIGVFRPSTSTWYPAAARPDDVTSKIVFGHRGRRSPCRRSTTAFDKPTVRRRLPPSARTSFQAHDVERHRGPRPLYGERTATSRCPGAASASAPTTTPTPWRVPGPATGRWCVPGHASVLWGEPPATPAARPTTTATAPPIWPSTGRRTTGSTCAGSRERLLGRRGRRAGERRLHRRRARARPTWLSTGRRPTPWYVHRLDHPDLRGATGAHPMERAPYHD